MKKTIFSGLLVITLLVFASCTTIPTFDDPNETDNSITTSELEGTWLLEFTFSLTKGYVDTFEDSTLTITVDTIDGKLKITDWENFTQLGDPEHLKILDTEYTYLVIVNEELRISLDLLFVKIGTSSTSDQEVFVKLIANKFNYNEANIITSIEGYFDDATTPAFLYDELSRKNYFSSWKLIKQQ